MCNEARIKLFGEKRTEKELALRGHAQGSNLEKIISKLDAIDKNELRYLSEGMRIVDKILQKHLVRILIKDYVELLEDTEKRKQCISLFIEEYLGDKKIRQKDFIWNPEIKHELSEILSMQIKMIISCAKIEFSTTLELFKSKYLSQEIIIDGLYIKSL